MRAPTTRVQVGDARLAVRAIARIARPARPSSRAMVQVAAGRAATGFLPFLPIDPGRPLLAAHCWRVGSGRMAAVVAALRSARRVSALPYLVLAMLAAGETAAASDLLPGTVIQDCAGCPEMV